MREIKILVIQEILYITGDAELLKRIDTRNIDEDNVKVLVATLWEEISIMPVENELMAISLLLKRIVDLTGSFYESRITKSNFISYLIEQHGISKFSETRRRRMDEFFNLLGSIITNFILSKDTFSRILSILLGYFHIFRLSHLLRMMEEKDKYYCLYILHNHSHSRRISNGLKTFLKKALLGISNPN